MQRALSSGMARLLGNGRYVLGEQLGVGGMGAVYAAVDLARTECVAIKIGHCDEVIADVIARHMARELSAGRATRHPNVVTVLDGGCDEGRPFIVMELATGRTLSELAAQDLSTARVGAIVDQLLAGLSAIHDAGYVHGDVKPDNVLVTRGSDGLDRVTIIDLGLACEHGRSPSATTEERVISGTPHYLAPELAQGAAKTVASELYAVGVVLYELLTGTTPFAGDGILEILRQQLDDEVMAPSQRAPQLNLSIALERVVLRALHKEPHERYASASEFRSALRAATQMTRDTPIACHAMSTTGPTLAWTRPDLPPARARAVGTSPPATRAIGRVPLVIVEAALDATRAHLAAHRLATAREELEAALRLLDDDGVGDRDAWRLLLPLAAICDRLADPFRARRLARLALDCAARTGSSVGRRRAKALIERFAGRSRMCA
jgi:serine/threonine protein kinase